MIFLNFINFILNFDHDFCVLDIAHCAESFDISHAREI